MADLVCKQCGRPLKQNGSKKFCSIKCRDEYRVNQSIIDGKRQCSKCNQWRNISTEYYTKNGRAGWCKYCLMEHNNKPHRKAKQKEWYENNRSRYIDYDRKAKLNATDADLVVFRQDYQVQAGKCKICGLIKTLAYDHNHKTGKYRGAICLDCNRGLGDFHDSIQFLQGAIKYLEEHND